MVLSIASMDCSKTDKSGRPGIDPKENNLKTDEEKESQMWTIVCERKQPNDKKLYFSKEAKEKTEVLTRSVRSIDLLSEIINKSKALQKSKKKKTKRRFDPNRTS